MGSLCCLTGLLTFHMRHNMVDDAYIYLRIVQNITSGHGWVFNNGVTVNAATSPFYAALLAAISTLRLSGIATALIATDLGLCALGVTIYYGSLDRGRLPALLLALTACTYPSLLATVGLEPATYLACIALTALFCQRRQPILMGLFAGLTALGRPEGMAMLPIVLVAEVLRDRKFSWKTIAAFAAVVTPWIVFSFVEFHTVVPHTMKVKAIQAGTNAWSGSWFRSFLDQLSVPKVFVPLALVGLARSIADFNKRPFLLLIVVFGCVQVAGYSVLGAPISYAWYTAPGNLAYCLSAILGILSVLEFVSAKAANQTQMVYSLATCVLIFGFLVKLSVQVRSYSAEYRYSAEYKAVGTWIQKHSNSGDWVACSEIGYIGYFSGRNIRDMLGLLEPGSIGPLMQHREDWWFTDDPEPRFIVVHVPSWMGEPDGLEHPWPVASTQDFHNNYRRVYEAGKVDVFERQP